MLTIATIHEGYLANTIINCYMMFLATTTRCMVLDLGYVFGFTFALNMPLSYQLWLLQKLILTCIDIVSLSSPVSICC